MRIFLDFKLQTAEWGEVRISRVIPYADDPWGQLTGIKETPWGKEVVQVTGENLSHALHGRVMPLLRTLGVPPRVHLDRIPEAWRTCTMSKGCINFRQENCQPCLQLPDCYIPPMVSLQQQELVTRMALAWRDGFYIVTVEGAEFVL